MISTKISVNCTKLGEYREKIGYELLSRCLALRPIPIQRLLEIGPGDGKLIARFITQNKVGKKSLTLVEPNKIFYDQLKTRFKFARLISERFEGYAKNFEDRYFNMVFSHFSLHWLENIPAVVYEIYRVLESNGVFAFTITDQNRSFWGKINKEFEKTFNNCSIFNVEQSHNMSIQEWKNVLTKSGFCPYQENVISGTAALFSSPEMCLRDLKINCADAYLRISPLFTAAQCEEWLISRLQQLIHDDGKIHINASAFQGIYKRP